MDDKHYYDYLEDLNISEEDKQALYHTHEQDKRKDKDRMIEVELKREERERKLLATRIALKLATLGIAGTIAVAGMVIITGRKNTRIDPYTNRQTIAYDDSRITLTRKYTIRFNDTIDGLAASTGIPKEDIIYDNHIDNPNLIQMDHHLVLNYSIDPEDIKYYTQSVKVEGRSLSQIAGEYDTTVNTLMTLNESAIEDGMIISDTILVPNFITQKELKEAKGQTK